MALPWGNLVKLGAHKYILRIFLDSKHLEIGTKKNVTFENTENVDKNSCMQGQIITVNLCRFITMTCRLVPSQFLFVSSKCTDSSQFHTHHLYEDLPIIY